MRRIWGVRPHRDCTRTACYGLYALQHRGAIFQTTVESKRVVMIDASIVRGTTCRQIVELLREAGAKEVHMRVSAPPFIAPCYFGTGIPDKDRLIACHHSIVEIQELTGTDSLGCLSLEALHPIASDASCGFCDGCFAGHYPIPLQ